MVRPIDADALIKVIERESNVDGAYGYMDTKSIIDVIDDAPPIESERKTGKWVLHENQRQEDVDNGNYLYVCSECGKSDLHAKTQEVPFCWWCGADMRGGGRE